MDPLAGIVPVLLKSPPIVYVLPGSPRTFARIVPYGATVVGDALNVLSASSGTYVKLADC